MLIFHSSLICWYSQCLRNNEHSALKHDSLFILIEKLFDKWSRTWIFIRELHNTKVLSCLMVSKISLDCPMLVLRCAKNYAVGVWRRMKYEDDTVQVSRNLILGFTQLSEVEENSREVFWPLGQRSDQKFLIKQLDETQLCVCFCLALSCLCKICILLSFSHKEWKNNDKVIETKLCTLQYYNQC